MFSQFDDSKIAFTNRPVDVIETDPGHFMIMLSRTLLAHGKQILLLEHHIMQKKIRKL